MRVELGVHVLENGNLGTETFLLFQNVVRDGLYVSC